jgi:Ca-activated chloride channel homolog
LQGLAVGVLLCSVRGGALAHVQRPTFRGEVDLVPVAVTVTDKAGAPVIGLNPDAFEILEDGRPQTLAFFARGDVDRDPTAARPPLHLGVLLDTSLSMRDDVAFTRTAAIRFLNRLQEAVDITVVDFDTEVRVARYSQADFPRVVERIRQQKVRGLTALYDAIGTYLDGAAGQDGRKVMLLYTDAGDTRSALSRNELMNLLKASDVTVYAIGSLAHQPMSVRSESERVLRQIATVTGGQAFFPDSLEDLDAIYTKVVGEIRAQYTLGYTSTNRVTDGAWRKVRIRLTAPSHRALRVRAREGYFAPRRQEP